MFFFLSFVLLLKTKEEIMCFLVQFYLFYQPVLLVDPSISISLCILNIDEQYMSSSICILNVGGCTACIDRSVSDLVTRKVLINNTVC